MDSTRDTSNYAEIGGMQQIEEDAVVQEDFDIGVSNAIEEDDPFTEAGSSVCRSRVTYSDGEVSAVLSVFKDLIEGDRDIKKAEVLDRFKSHRELEDMYKRYLPLQLVNKVRTERKCFKRRQEKLKRNRKR